MKKPEASFADYFLKIDQEKSFTKRKFTELQRMNQRKKKLKRKIIAKKQRSKGAKWLKLKLFYFILVLGIV